MGWTSCEVHDLLTVRILVRTDDLYGPCRHWYLGLSQPAAWAEASPAPARAPFALLGTAADMVRLP